MCLIRPSRGKTIPHLLRLISAAKKKKDRSTPLELIVELWSYRCALSVQFTFSRSYGSSFHILLYYISGLIPVERSFLAFFFVPALPALLSPDLYPSIHTMSTAQVGIMPEVNSRRNNILTNFRTFHSSSRAFTRSSMKTDQCQN